MKRKETRQDLELHLSTENPKPAATQADPAAEQARALSAVAAIFAHSTGEKAFAALHELLFERGIRRLTIATIDRDVTSPVQYHYHADRGAQIPEPLDAQTLAFALASEQLCELPTVAGVRNIDPAARNTRGRLAFAMVAPIRVAGAIIGFSAIQSDAPLTSELGALLECASVLIGQDLEIAREAALCEHGAKELTLLLETARALSSGLDLADLFAKFHTLVGRVMDASLFVAALLTPDGDQLEIEYSAEFGKRSVERIRLPLTTVSGDVLKSGHPVIIRRPEDWNTVRSVTLGDAQEPASALIVPMKLGDRVLGVLSVQSPRANSYSDTDCELLTAISEQAAVAVENLRNLRASTQRAADLNLLVEVASAVSSELDLHRVFAKIYEQVKRVIDAPLFFVALRSSDDKSDVTLEYLVEGERVFPPATHSVEGTIVGRVIEAGKPILVRNTEERDRLSQKRVGEGPTTVQSIVAVPMTVGGRIIGAISTQSYIANAYDERHLKLLNAIAEQSSVAVQNAKLYERAKELAENDALTGLPHQRSVQERLAYELKRARRANAKVALLMMDIDKFKAFNDTYGHPVGDSVLKEVAAVLRRVARETDVIGRYGGDEFCAILPDTDREAAWKFAERLNTEITRKPFEIDDRQSIPIRLSIGVAVYPDECEGREDLVGVADAALYAAKRGEAEQALRSEDLIASLEGDLQPFGAFISALANAGRTKREQLINVNHLAAKYAAAIELDDHQRHVLLCSAALLDIGELAIPGLILSKPGKLEKEDYEIIKKHPEFAYQMLSSLRDCEAIAIAVRHHAERFDGTGYPHGLAGEDIPRLSRILAVLEAYVAMTSDRPYRPKKTREEARQELQACAGKQFDPRVVETFLALDV
ncbi:MAG TPA: diguanylate cyclase [Candidatus Acidoferrales bacterium]|nr:diguanylate cyclase [Candidatus Acidoferrales bacterium]